MSPEHIGFALLILGIFLLLGKWIRMRVELMQNLFLPASVIGGFVALFLGRAYWGGLPATSSGRTRSGRPEY